MKRIIINIVLFCSLIIFLSANINAEIIVNKYKIDDDFLLSSNNAAINACACSTFLDFVTVENIGNVPSAYTISSDSSFVNLYPGSFTLEPNQKIKLLNYVRVPCNVNDFNFNVLVATNRGLQKVMKQSVKVDKCQNLLLSPIINEAVIDPCENATFSFLINNIDGFTETYYFDLDAFSESALFTENPVVIESMKSKIVSFMVNPDCSYHGLYNISLIAEAKYNNVKAYMPLSLKINNKYNFSLSGSDNIDTCYKAEKETEFEIYNFAEFENEYEISLIGPSWAKLSANKFTLEPNQKGIFTLNVKPNSIGEFDAKIIVKSKFGDLKAVKDVKIIVNDCYKFSLFFVEDKICKDDNAINLVIKNEGKFDENFELSLLAPDFISLNDKFVFVEAGNEAQVKINVGEDGRYNSYHLEAKARIPGKEFIEKTAVDLEIIPLNKCYKAELKPTIKFVDYNRNDVELSLINNGLKDDRYAITSVKPDWVRFSDEQYFMQKGDATTLTLISEPTGDVRGGAYKIIFYIESENAEQVYVDNLYLVVSNNNIAGKIASFLYNFWYLVLLIALIILVLVIWLIISLLKRKKQPKKTKKKEKKEKRKSEFDKKNIKWIIIAAIILLLIIGAVVVFFYFDVKIPFDKILGTTVPALVNDTQEELVEDMFNCGDYEGEDICDSSLYIKINKNSEYILELEDFFFDPDGDSLEYQSSTPKNINIEIEGSKAVLTPKRDWTGTEEVVFIASDPNDDLIVSDIFVLHVIEGKMSLWDRIKAIFS